jgi:hypothetical protein
VNGFLRANAAQLGARTWNAAGEVDVTVAGGGIVDIAHGALDQLLDDFSRPSYRAGFGVSVLSAAVLSKLGARMSVAVIVSVMIGLSVERLYEMAEDVHGKLTAEPVKLLFHGFGCPGHTTGMPAESCLADTDAHSKV